MDTSSRRFLSRYYPSDVSMHSFDKNASSVHKKRDNWGQLVKVFKKHGLDVRTREWEAVCASEEGAALELVGKFHRILAGSQHFQGATRAARASSGSTASNRSNPHPGGSTPARRVSPNRPAHDGEGDRAGRISTRELLSGGGSRVHPPESTRGASPRGGGGGVISTVDIVTTRLSENLADEYVEEPRPFRFNPSGGGAFDWEAYQREFMNPGRREDPPVADDDRFEDEPGPEPEPEEAVEPEYAPRGRQQRGMRPASKPVG